VAPEIQIIGFAPKCLLKLPKDFPGLGDLLAEHPEHLTLTTCHTADAFQAALAPDPNSSRQQPITLVASYHGGWSDVGKVRDFKLYSGQEKLQHEPTGLVLPAIQSHGVVISACYVLDENQNLPPLLRSALQGRAWTAGIDVVPRSHVVWYAKYLIERGGLDQINSPQAALEALLEVDAILEAKRDAYRASRLEKQRQKRHAETKPWRALWSRPTL